MFDPGLHKRSIFFLLPQLLCAVVLIASGAEASLADRDEDSLSNLSRRVELSNAEKQYLQKKQRVSVVCDPNWPPFEQITANGDYIGIAPDFQHVISRTIGLPIRLIPTPSWPASLEQAKTGKADLVSLLNPTEGRREYLNFTTPLLHARVVVVGRGESVSSDLHELKGRTVAVVRGYKMEEDMRRDHPEIPLLSLDTTEETLLAVGDGRAHATVVTRLEAHHYIRVHGLEGLREISDTGYTLDLSIGVRKDDPVLLAILQKTINAMTFAERKAIEERWITTGEDNLPLGASIILLSSGLLVIIIWMFLSRRRKRG